MSPRYTLLASLFTLLASAPAAQPSCPSSSAAATLDAGEVRAVVYPNGNLFWRGSGSQYEVPAGSRIYAIFSSTLWVGGTVGGQPRFSGSTYGPWEFRPGALDADGQPPADCAAHDRIWHVSLEDVAAYNATGTATPDLAEWPASLGAPVLDGDGDPDNYDLAAGDRPAILGSQTAWWVMNDLTADGSWGGTPPVGLEVRVTAFGWEAPYAITRLGSIAAGRAAQYATAYRFEVTHRGAEPAEDLYIGMFNDVDLGEFTDDFVGSAPERRMVYVYNGDDDDDDQYGPSPPAIGLATRDPGPGVRTVLGPVYKSSVSPIGDPDSGEEAYNLLRGMLNDGSARWTLGGFGYGGTTPTDVIYPGLPPAYWSEFNVDKQGTSNIPADRRAMLSQGPYTLADGETARFDVVIPWSRSTLGHIASVNQLLDDAEALEAMPFTPDPALLTITPDQIPVAGERGPRASALDVRVGPNPARARATVRVDVPAPGRVALTVTDALGRRVQAVQAERAAGPYEVALATDGLAPGLYVVTVATADARASARLVVSR